MVHKVQQQGIRTALLTEMIARIMKCLMHEKFREKMQELRVPCEEPYKETVANFLNLVISRDSSSPSSSPPLSATGPSFWGLSLQTQISQKFAVVYGSLDLNEETPDCELLFGAGIFHYHVFYILSFSLFILIHYYRGTTKG